MRFCFLFFLSLAVSATEFKLIKTTTERSFTIERYQAQDSELKQEFSFYFYRTKISRLEQAHKTPSILYSPPIGPILVIDQWMARRLAKRGFNVLICEMGEFIGNKNRTPEQIGDFFHHSMRSLELGLAFLKFDPGVDANRIFSFGMSMGGIRSISIALIHPEVKKAVGILAGSDFSYILTHSVEPQVKAYRQHYQTQRQLSLADYHQLIKANIPFDLKDLVQKTTVNPQRFFLFTGLGDRTVPTVKQHELWELLGRPTRRKVILGHYGGAFFSFLQLKAAEKFFLRQMKE